LPLLTVHYSGFVNSDSETDLTTLPHLTTTATAGSHVGTYTISVGGATDPNYDIRSISGTLTVTPANLTIMANDQSMTAGDPLPLLTVHYDGFVNGDDASHLATLPQVKTPATSNSAAGSYTLLPEGAADPDYSFDYQSGTLTILPKATRSSAVAYDAVGADAGGGPQITVYNAVTGTQIISFYAFPSTFTGGVRVAVADVNSDGIPDIICGAGAGGMPQVTVFDGATFQPIISFFAFPGFFTGGVYVAAGDVNGDGQADIVCGAGAGGGPEVSVFNGLTGAGEGAFFAYPLFFTGGVRVAVGDVTGFGTPEIITGAGRGAAPQVNVFNGTNFALIEAFLAFPALFTNGVYVAAGDVNREGRAAIIVGAGAGGGPQVSLFNGITGTPIASFFDPRFGGVSDVAGVSNSRGVRVGVVTVNGQTEVLVASGAGTPALVDVFNGSSIALLDEFFAFDPAFQGGAFVGG
jgi:hypothetical protein